MHANARRHAGVGRGGPAQSGTGGSRGADLLTARRAHASETALVPAQRRVRSDSTRRNDDRRTVSGVPAPREAAPSSAGAASPRWTSHLVFRRQLSRAAAARGVPVSRGSRRTGSRGPSVNETAPAAAYHDEAAHRRDANRAVGVSAIGLALTGGIELALAIVTGSVALLGDALHNLSDVSTSAVVFLGFRISKRKPTTEYPYGYERAED